MDTWYITHRDTLGSADHVGPLDRDDLARFLTLFRANPEHYVVSRDGRTWQPTSDVLRDPAASTRTAGVRNSTLEEAAARRKLVRGVYAHATSAAVQRERNAGGRVLDAPRSVAIGVFIMWIHFLLSAAVCVVLLLATLGVAVIESSGLAMVFGAMLTPALMLTCIGWWASIRAFQGSQTGRVVTVILALVMAVLGLAEFGRGGGIVSLVSMFGLVVATCCLLGRAANEYYRDAAAQRWPSGA